MSGIVSNSWQSTYQKGVVRNLHDIGGVLSRNLMIPGKARHQLSLKTDSLPARLHVEWPESLIHHGPNLHVLLQNPPQRCCFWGAPSIDDFLRPSKVQCHGFFCSPQARAHSTCVLRVVHPVSTNHLPLGPPKITRCRFEEGSGSIPRTMTANGCRSDAETGHGSVMQTEGPTGRKQSRQLSLTRSKPVTYLP